MPLSGTSMTKAFRASWIVLSCARRSFSCPPFPLPFLALSMSADACAAAMARGVAALEAYCEFNPAYLYLERRDR